MFGVIVCCVCNLKCHIKCWNVTQCQYSGLINVLTSTWFCPSCFEFHSLNQQHATHLTSSHLTTQEENSVERNHFSILTTEKPSNNWIGSHECQWITDKLRYRRSNCELWSFRHYWPNNIQIPGYKHCETDRTDQRRWRWLCVVLILSPWILLRYLIPGLSVGIVGSGHSQSIVFSIKCRPPN